MVQTGDPTGTGKGGESIWGKNFEDEIRSNLRVLLSRSLYQHNTRGVVSMANKGPDTNSSQL